MSTTEISTKVSEAKNLLRSRTLSASTLRKFNRNTLDELLLNLQKDPDFCTTSTQDTSAIAAVAALTPLFERLLDKLGLMIKDLVDDFTSKLEQLSVSFTERVSSLEKENSLLQNEQVLLKDQVEELQQYSRRDNILIHGLPANLETSTTPETCAVDCLNSLFPDVRVTSTDISVAHRIPPKSGSTRPAPLIVRFSRRCVRNKILQLAKDKKNSQRLRQEGKSVTEHLTSSRQHLLKRGKAIASEYRAVCCWSREGQVYLRNLNLAVVKIKSATDLTPYENCAPRKELVDRYWEDQKRLR